MAKFASVEPVDVVWGETGPMEFDIHSFDKLEDLGFGKRVPLGQLTGPDLLSRSASSATSLESTLLIYDRGNLARSIGADFFVRDSIKPAITLTNSESAMAHGVKRTLRSVLLALQGAVKGEGYSKAQLELAKMYGATSPGTLDPLIESSFASLSNFETKLSPRSYRAAALIEAINRMFLDVTESIEIVERMPIEQLVLPSEGFGAVCTNPLLSQAAVWTPSRHTLAAGPV